jgi:hypothetical protein
MEEGWRFSLVVGLNLARLAAAATAKRAGKQDDWSHEERGTKPGNEAA